MSFTLALHLYVPMLPTLTLHTLTPKLPTAKFTRGSSTSQPQNVRSWWQLRGSLLTTKSSRSSTSKRRCTVCVACSGVGKGNMYQWPRSRPSVTPFLEPHSKAINFVTFCSFPFHSCNSHWCPLYCYLGVPVVVQVPGFLPLEHLK